MKIAVLLLLAAAAAVQGRDPAATADDQNHQREVTGSDRSKRWSGIGLFDALRGKGRSPETKPTKPTAGDGLGFNLADALHPDPKTSKPPRGNDSGFELEDALHPAVKPTDGPTEGDCQQDVVQKLGTIIQNQKQELQLLLKLLARLS